jgi:hypothetical protein
MTYKQSLKPWGVVRLLPTWQWAIVGQYRSCSDADGHLQLLRRRVPEIEFQVVFDLEDSASGCRRADCKK